MSWFRLYEKMKASAPPQLRHFACPLADDPKSPCPTAFTADYAPSLRCRTHELEMLQVSSEDYWRRVGARYRNVQLCDDVTCWLAGNRALFRVTWRVQIGPGYAETVTAKCCAAHALAKQFGQTGRITLLRIEPLTREG